MNLIVLVKQIPDTESIIQVTDDGLFIKTQNLKWIMNPYDELAVEEALRIKESCGGTVTIVSMGDLKTQETIRHGLAMGADKGILIHDPAVDGSDVLGTAKILAAALKKMDYDLIVAGQRAMDEDNYSVGSAVAEYLDIPQISMVIKQKIANGKITCHRMVDGGQEVIEANLPALFTTQRGLNEPRYVSLPGMMKAKKKKVDVYTLADLEIDPDTVGVKARKVKLVKLRFPHERRAVRLMEGESAQEKTSNLIKILHEEIKVL